MHFVGYLQDLLIITNESLSQFIHQERTRKYLLSFTSGLNHSFILNTSCMKTVFSWQKSWCLDMFLTGSQFINSAVSRSLQSQVTSAVRVLWDFDLLENTITGIITRVQLF